MVRHNKKILLICLLAFLIIPINIKADRVTFGDVLDELAELERQKAEKDNEIQISQQEYDRLSNEIYQIQIEIENLSKSIGKSNRGVIGNSTSKWRNW